MTIPERIGRYRVVGHLATGGMAEILLGKLLGPGGFERVVVLKRALPHLARQREFRDMFLDEARVVARIRHPNVVHVTELGEEGSELFMVMEYLAGESVSGMLRRLLQSGEWLPAEVSAYLIAETLAGLHAAHELDAPDGAPLGLVHRDISPQNLFVAYDGRIKVLDFGIAKFLDRSVETSTGHLKGKFAYMSPEQCRAEPVDRRSDVFAAAIVLWELLTASRLFQRGNELLTWKAIVEEDTPRPSDRLRAGLPAPPEKLEAIVMRALSKDADARPASADVFRRELLAVLREIDPDDRAGETLAAIMGRLFADRIAQKRELLRRVHAGDEVTSVPAAEADPQSEPGAGEPAFGNEVSTIAPPPQDSGKRRFAMGILALALACIGAISAYALWPSATQQAAAEPRAPETLAVAPAPSASPPPQPMAASDEEDVATPAPSAVRVSLELVTTPPGAQLRRATERTVLGVTPCAVELAASSEPLELELTLEGYRTHVERIVPDVNQRVRVTLTRERRARTGRGGTGGEGAPSTTDEGSGQGGFFRFD